ARVGDCAAAIRAVIGDDRARGIRTAVVRDSPTRVVRDRRRDDLQAVSVVEETAAGPCRVAADSDVGQREGLPVDKDAAAASVGRIATERAPADGVTVTVLVEAGAVAAAG